MKEEILKRLLDNGQITEEECCELGGKAHSIQKVVDLFKLDKDGCGFDSQKCLDVMKHLDWKWLNRTPTLNEFNEKLNELIKACIIRICEEIKEDPNKEHTAGVGTGGIEVRADYYPKDIDEDEVIRISSSFVVEEWSELLDKHQIKSLLNEFKDYHE